MTFEDVWNKIKAVKFTSILGFYGNAVSATIGIAFFAIVLLCVGLLVLKIFVTIPWPVLLLLFVGVSGVLCMEKWGWGGKPVKFKYVAWRSGDGGENL